MLMRWWRNRRRRWECCCCRGTMGLHVERIMLGMMKTWKVGTEWVCATMMQEGGAGEGEEGSGSGINGGVGEKNRMQLKRQPAVRRTSPRVERRKWVEVGGGGGATKRGGGSRLALTIGP